MTLLLISAKNVEEAMLLARLGVDVVDLKDPEIGALGALDLDTTKEIMDVIRGKACVSATVGEDFADLSSLQKAIELRSALGVDIVKMVVNEITLTQELTQLVQSQANQHVKLIAVLFADEVINLDWLIQIKRAGFFGAMIDTKNKAHSLLEVREIEFLEQFVEMCKLLNLVSGIAGSLKPQHIDFFGQISPTYFGFRGGVCVSHQRKSTILEFEVVRLMNMLSNHNRIGTKSLKSINLALQT